MTTKKLPFRVVANERIDEADIYLVGVRGDESIVRYRDGKAERLKGAEKERVRRWLLREPTTGGTER